MDNSKKIILNVLYTQKGLDVNAIYNVNDILLPNSKNICSRKSPNLEMF